MDASSLLFSSLKMQENLALTGGKEARPLWVDLETGQVQYECGMDGDCRQYGVSSPETLKDVIVVQNGALSWKGHCCEFTPLIGLSGFSRGVCHG